MSFASRRASSVTTSSGTRISPAAVVSRRPLRVPVPGNPGPVGCDDELVLIGGHALGFLSFRLGVVSVGLC